MKGKSSRFSVVIFALMVTGVAFSRTQSTQGPPPLPAFAGEAPKLDDIGKNVVIGELKKVEATKLTISRPDGTEQSVLVDANTKFFGERGEAITLGDFKVGDRVGATGTLKDGVFAAAKLGKAPSVPSAPPAPPAPPSPSSSR